MIMEIEGTFGDWSAMAQRRLDELEAAILEVEIKGWDGDSVFMQGKRDGIREMIGRFRSWLRNPQLLMPRDSIYDLAREYIEDKQ